MVDMFVQSCEDASMLNAVIIFCIVVAYGLLGGVTYAIGYIRDQGEWENPRAHAAVMGTLWPFMLPAYLGMVLVERIKDQIIPIAIVNNEK